MEWQNGVFGGQQFPVHWGGDNAAKEKMEFKKDVRSPMRKLTGTAAQNMNSGWIDMKIRNSTIHDINRIMEIYAFAREYMAEHGNPNQWGPTNWPPEALIRRDIAAGNSYVCENDGGTIVGTFFFIHGADIEPTYRTITEGVWLDSSPYGVVHRIASDASEKGIGTFCLNWAYKQCSHLRIDTHGDNLIMQNLLGKLGFIHCGTIYVEEDDDPRLAYEKSEKIKKQ